ncbi:MAG: MipA/OmpV family protein [Gammaproteobacteria bacterium]|nr:MipA/OmpV family protein [Gammaproteobacteria bacterium]MCW8942432.1 MipA/OmpV family protein [Gammaproteobacteria bacterium]
MNISRTIFFSGLIFLYSSKIIAADITVRIDNPPESGSVALVLFDSANTFGDLRDPFRVDIHQLDGRDEYLIDDVEPGEYALMVYFDENGNKRMDKNFIGIPKEPLGFSNRYRPKGPPAYERAAFTIGQAESRSFDVELYRPLGKFGRIGLGAGIIFRSSPYRDYNGAVSQVIPAITYNGDRLQIFGPKVVFGLAGSGKLRLAATGRYRIGVYDEDDSDFLQGMGDREDTFMAGLAIQAELPGGIDLSASYEHDVLDRIGGGEARLEFGKSLQAGVFRFFPAIAFNWTSSELSNHDFGVPDSQATAERPAYYLDDVYSVEAGLGFFIEITRDWLVIMNVAAESLSNDVTASPIVSEDYVIKGFAAVNYVF